MSHCHLYNSCPKANTWRTEFCHNTWCLSRHTWYASPRRKSRRQTASRYHHRQFASQTFTSNSHAKTGMYQQQHWWYSLTTWLALSHYNVTLPLNLRPKANTWRTEFCHNTWCLSRHTWYASPRRKSRRQTAYHHRQFASQTFTSNSHAKTGMYQQEHGWYSLTTWLALSHYNVTLPLIQLVSKSKHLANRILS